MRKNIGIYVHIPFCTRRCGYCDFLTFAHLEHIHQPYTSALVKEIEKCEELEAYNITSIFFGGGTPTNLTPEMLTAIFTALNKYHIDPNAEVTIESNPGTLSLTMLRTLKSLGVNRLSMGLQSWHNKTLKQIERGHSREEFLQNFKHARKLGFDNINVDLIFSLPRLEGGVYSDKEAFALWYDTLRHVVALKPDHISVYSLIIEEGTRFYTMEQKGQLILQSEALDRRMYHFSQGYLKRKGYNQYEISNFAKPDKHCKHNLLYWQRGEYIGFGLGSSGFVGGHRQTNIRGLNKYIEVVNAPNYKRADVIETQTLIDKQEAMEEFMYLGLRCLEGISTSVFETTFGEDIRDVFGEAIKSNLNNGLLIEEKNQIRLTQMGLDISNRVFSDFLS